MPYLQQWPTAAAVAAMEAVAATSIGRRCSLQDGCGRDVMLALSSMTNGVCRPVWPVLLLLLLWLALAALHQRPKAYATGRRPAGLCLSLQLQG